MLIGDLMQRFSGRSVDNSLRIDPAKEVNQQMVRTQEVTFLEPQLIDSAQSIYIIPVSQVNLEKPESVNDSELLNTFSKGSIKRPYYSYSGPLNNILVYQPLQNLVYPIFKEKIHISRFEHHEINDQHYLILAGANADSNQDGKLNQSDLHAFFIYNLQANKLQGISEESLGLESFHLLWNTQEFLLRFGKDKNQDGEFDPNTEPVIVKRFNIMEKSSMNLLDEGTMDNLQQLID